ncbi:hypothetical protein M514_17390 [Trichuris suis]|uniref:Uncharacterized protein n=1 Tax=Trichuris suis TaxID=68888 RepID=A0A085NLG0_9BILA|nr:hypothetical protein M514_17390 [Trichuris suis]
MSAFACVPQRGQIGMSTSSIRDLILLMPTLDVYQIYNIVAYDPLQYTKHSLPQCNLFTNHKKAKRSTRSLSYSKVHAAISILKNNQTIWHFNQTSCLRNCSYASTDRRDWFYEEVADLELPIYEFKVPF